jgi:uncharacterized protein (TIGR02145 family)
MAQHILHLQFKIFRMKNIIVIILTTFFGSFINAQVIPIGFIKAPANNIPSVVIGTQQWMLQNLDVTTYRNGDPIPQVTDPTLWNNLNSGAWCYYNNDPANGTIYGKLYNWYAVNDSRGLAPLGWHVPDNTEWDILSTFLGGMQVAGAKMKMTGTTSWNSPNSGTNESGFTGLGSGYRSRNFYSLKIYGVFWSATSQPSSFIYYFNNTFPNLFSQSFSKNNGVSVRLIKD